MHVSFHFQGTKDPLPDQSCMFCIAASGFNPPHVCHAGCGICSARASKVCGTHSRGAKGALDTLEKSLSPEDAEAFAPVRLVLDAELALMGGASHVKIDVSMSSGFHEDEDGARTGNPVRSCTFEVLELA